MQIVFWDKNDPKKVDYTLYSDKAEALAREIAEDNQRSKGRRENKRTQIRKFYDEVLRLEASARMIKSHPGDADGQESRITWEDLLPMVHMLAAKAAYAKGRELISDNFLNFIKDAVRQVKKPEDLSVFANFFEAFMGFYRLYGPNN